MLKEDYETENKPKSLQLVISKPWFRNFII
jgi:hypothetical protein